MEKSSITTSNDVQPKINPQKVNTEEKKDPPRRQSNRRQNVPKVLYVGCYDLLSAQNCREKGSTRVSWLIIIKKDVFEETSEIKIEDTLDEQEYILQDSNRLLQKTWIFKIR